MMRIGDEIYVHGYVDEIRKDTVIIRNNGGYFGTVSNEIVSLGYTDGYVQGQNYVMNEMLDIINRLNHTGMIRENEKRMWENLMILLFGNPSKKTMDGLSNIVNGGYDVETAVNMIDELVKKDAALSALRHTKEDMKISYIKGWNDAIVKAIDETGEEALSGLLMNDDVLKGGE